MATIGHNALARRFTSLFDDPAAQEALAELGARTSLPTFNLATTSLRYLSKWFDRLEDINSGQTHSRGNFISDPANIGLVDNTVAPPVLTPAGQEFLSYKSILYDDSAQAEYQLLKLLYSGNHIHDSKVQAVLENKRETLLRVIRQFGSPREEFLSHPSLLVIAELIASFPGALPKFAALSSQDLIRLAELGEQGFASLCSEADSPKGLSRLCKRIGGDYTRAEERRLHHIVSMALLTIASSILPGGTAVLQVPSPYSNLLTKQDIFNLHARYTSDLVVWLDGVSYLVSTSMSSVIAAGAESVHGGALQPQRGAPRIRRASASDTSRHKRRATQQEQITVIINPLLSENAEDFAEKEVLRSRYGARLVRAGHRSGEVIPLPDGLVPGADFYVVDDADAPIQFIEIKCMSGDLPANISLTRAEYLRVCKCVAEGIPYGLMLVDLAQQRCLTVDNFDEHLAKLGLGEVVQFTVEIK